MTWHLHQDKSAYEVGGRPLCPICGSGLRSIQFVPNVPLREVLEAILVPSADSASKSPRMVTTTAVQRTNTRKQVGPDLVDSVQTIALSSDGNRVAVGFDIGSGSFRACIYDLTGRQWTQVGDALEKADEWCYEPHIALSSDGNRVAIGTRMRASLGHGNGRIRIYALTRRRWLQMGSDLAGEETGISSYVALALALSSDGRRVAIRGNEFRARIFDWTGSRWTQVGANIDKAMGEGRKNVRIALSSDGVRVALQSGQNSVCIFGWTGSQWTQVGSDLVGEARGDLFGESIALSSDGNRIAIGAPGTLQNVGRVHIYDWIENQWVHEGHDLVGIGTKKGFGSSVALSSNGYRVVVGSPKPGVYVEAGHVEVYDWNGSQWRKVGSDLVGQRFKDCFGRSVALSSNGNRVVIRASNFPPPGLVRIFDLEENHL